MCDPLMDAALDYLGKIRAERLHDEWVREYLILLAQELLCSSPETHEQIAYEMLAVIRGG